MPILHKNITNATDIHNPKWLSTANNGDYAWKNEKGELESTDEIVLPAALNFVDASVSPPTSNNGDIYILSSGGSVNAGWGSVAVGDWVRYDGALWSSITPQKSSLCYDKFADSLKFYNGLVWAGIGGGISSVTSAEKAALSPSTGDFVYDTDLNSLQRYNGSNWIDISKGYGLVEVVRDTDNGVPTYFVDLQSALETCKTSGSRNYVKLHSNFVVTTTVNMVYSGSGTGNGYLYESLILDLAGFKILNNENNNTGVIYNRLNGGSLTIINGSLIRTNGNGAETCLSVQHNTASNLTLNNITVYCENGWASYLSEVSNTDFINYSNFSDFGNSFFISDSSNRPAIQTTNNCSIENFTTISSGNQKTLLITSTSKSRNFKTISTGTNTALYSEGEVSHFYCENSSTGVGATIYGGTASHFFSKSVSSYAVNIGNSPKVTYFTAVAISGSALLATVGGRIENAELTSANSSYTCWIQNSGDINSVKSENTGTGKAFYLQLTQAISPIFTNLTGIANSKMACDISVQNVGGSISLYNSTMYSKLNSSAGISVYISNNDNNIDISNCTLKVVNASANNIAGTTTTINSINNTLIGATTPINASITVSSSTDLGNGNRSY
jgi:hypothetical protein